MIHKKIAYSIIFLLSIQTANATQKILTISPMNCGTHLLGKLITLLTGKKEKHPKNYALLLQKELDAVKANQFHVTHAIYTPMHAAIAAKNNLKTILIIRDPRDQILSSVGHIAQYPKEWPHLVKLNKYDLVHKLISEYDTFVKFAVPHTPKTITGMFDLYLPWRHQPGVYVTKFERLVGPKGGGNAKVQIQEIRNIAQHLGIKVTKEGAKRLADKLFGGTSTFRGGSIGKGIAYLASNPTLKEEFKKVGGHMLVTEGYEKDLNW